jgi:hypothetical protein
MKISFVDNNVSDVQAGNFEGRKGGKYARDSD